MKVIIDVDSTLFDFSKALHTELILKVDPNFPSPYMWNSWEYPREKSGITGGEFFKLVDEVHGKMGAYEPYPLAKEMLEYLKPNYKVIIATHRKEKFRDNLIEWLDDNGLCYDEVICTKDKSTLFGKDVKFIFDDKPSTLLKAKEAGVKAYGLLTAYNKVLRGKILLFKNMGDFLYYLIDYQY